MVDAVGFPSIDGTVSTSPLGVIYGHVNASRSLIASTNRFGSRYSAKRKLLFLPLGSSSAKSDGVL